MLGLDYDSDSSSEEETKNISNTNSQNVEIEDQATRKRKSTSESPEKRKKSNSKSDNLPSLDDLLGPDTSPSLFPKSSKNQPIKQSMEPTGRLIPTSTPAIIGSVEVSSNSKVNMIPLQVRLKRPNLVTEDLEALGYKKSSSKKK